MLSARGEPDRARELATEALATAEELGMAGIAAKARSALRVPLPRLLTRAEQFAFVGRTAERSVLDAAWRAADDGDRRVVLLAGEPGAGKTRLASEFARGAYVEGALVLGGRCDEGMGVPYQPFVEALSQLARHSSLRVADLGPLPGELVRLVPGLADRVPELPPAVNAEPETERYRLFEAVAGWLAATPAVLVIDDLHWAATPTLLLLRHIVRSSESMRVLVVATYRDTEVGDDLAVLLAELRRDDAAAHIALGGLTASEVAELSDAKSARALHASTAGNPLFLSQVLQHQAESGTTGVPQGVRDVLRQRLERLSAATVDALTTAAVVGAEFDPAIVGAACGVSEIEALDALDTAVAARLLSHQSQRWGFVHDVVRQTLLEALSRTGRATLHRAVGEALEAADEIDDRLPQLANHWCEAAPLGDTARAVEYATTRW